MTDTKKRNVYISRDGQNTEVLTFEDPQKEQVAAAKAPTPWVNPKFLNNQERKMAEQEIAARRKAPQNNQRKTEEAKQKASDQPAKPEPSQQPAAAPEPPKTPAELCPPRSMIPPAVIRQVEVTTTAKLIRAYMSSARLTKEDLELVMKMFLIPRNERNTYRRMFGLEAHGQTQKKPPKQPKQKANE